MESLVAWVKVTQKKRLRVVDLDADRSPELARRLGIRTTPTLLVMRGGSVLKRLEGRATGAEQGRELEQQQQEAEDAEADQLDRQQLEGIGHDRRRRQGEREPHRQGGLDRQHRAARHGRGGGRRTKLGPGIARVSGQRRPPSRGLTPSDRRRARRPGVSG